MELRFLFRTTLCPVFFATVSLGRHAFYFSRPGKESNLLILLLFMCEDLFRGVDPVNRDYRIGDLFDDAFSLIDKKHLLKDKTSEQSIQFARDYFEIVDLEGEEEVYLRKKIKEIFIDSRSIALTALKEGMTLDGKMLRVVIYRLGIF
jgi:hypothetical protein